MLGYTGGRAPTLKSTTTRPVERAAFNEPHAVTVASGNVPRLVCVSN